MAYRKRTSTRRRPRRTRRMPIRRRLSTRALRVHHFKRTFTLPYFTSSNTGNTYGGLSFNLNQLPNVTEFTNLYDMYRINKIVVKFVPNRSSSDVAATGEQIPNLNTVIDYTDATAPTSLSQLYEYQNWKMSRGINVHTRVITPASLDLVNATAGSNAGNPQWKQWISTSAPTIEHYGLKYGLETSASNNAIAVTPYISFYFSCKAVK